MQPHRAIALGRGQRAILALPVELLEVEAEAAEIEEGVLADGLARRVAALGAGQPQVVLDRAIDQRLAYRLPDLLQRGRPLAREALLLKLHREAHEVPHQPALQGRRFRDLHLQPRKQIVPAPRRGEEEGGRDFADVVHRGFLPLRDAERAPKRDGGRDRKGVVADPGHGQVAHQRVVLVEVAGLRGLMHRRDQVPVLERHALGLARRARRMKHHGPIVGAGALQQSAGQLRRGLEPGLALGQDGLIGKKIAGGIAGNAPRVVVDDDLRRALPLANLQELVGLLLVLHDGDAHARTR